VPRAKRAARTVWTSIIRGGRVALPVEAAISINPVATTGSTVGAFAPVWDVVTCVLTQSAVVTSAPIWAAGAARLHRVRLPIVPLALPLPPLPTRAHRWCCRRRKQSCRLELYRRRMCSIRRIRCFYFRSHCCQFRRRQLCCPRRCRYNRCCCSLVFLCRDDLGHLLVPHTLSDRA
jgi:hypothetical protein